MFRLKLSSSGYFQLEGERVSYFMQDGMQNLVRTVAHDDVFSICQIYKQDVA